MNDPAVSHFLTAHKDPAAVALSREVNLPLPTNIAQFRGLMGHMNRLVATGKDTPENLALWFGHESELCRKIHKEARMYLLLPPSQDSLAHTMQSYNLGQGGSLTFSPRPATDKELVEAERLQEMQHFIGLGYRTSTWHHLGEGK